jgi:hypothetical protein
MTITGEVSLSLSHTFFMKPLTFFETLVSINFVNNNLTDSDI